MVVFVISTLKFAKKWLFIQHSKFLHRVLFFPVLGFLEGPGPSPRPLDKACRTVYPWKVLISLNTVSASLQLYWNLSHTLLQHLENSHVRTPPNSLILSQNQRLSTICICANILEKFKTSSLLQKLDIIPFLCALKWHVLYKYYIN